MFELLLMRHAKSDWHNDLTDIERPLSRRGRRDAEHMGVFLRKNVLIPDRVLTSPARRTQETINLLNKNWQLKPEQIQIDEELYLADKDILLERAAAHAEEEQRIMVLAHNPGMDDVVNLITAGKPALSESGKLMVAAAVACFKVEKPGDLGRTGKCQLIGLYRPKEI